jgi:hypothetical protein
MSLVFRGEKLVRAVLQFHCTLAHSLMCRAWTDLVKWRSAG